MLKVFRAERSLVQLMSLDATARAADGFGWWTPSSPSNVDIAAIIASNTR